MNEEIDMDEIEAKIERLRQSPEYQQMLRFAEQVYLKQCLI